MIRWRRKVLLIVLPVCIAGAAAISLLHPALPEKLDLLGMIRGIQLNNDSINEVNGHIAQNMTDISELSDTTVRIGTHLHTLRSGMQGQDELLVQLDNLSEQEVELSGSLHELAGQLRADLEKINGSAQKQKRAVHGMHQSAQSLSAAAAQAESTNKAMAEKLSQAAELTKQVENSMP